MSKKKPEQKRSKVGKVASFFRKGKEETKSEQEVVDTAASPVVGSEENESEQPAPDSPEQATATAAVPETPAKENRMNLQYKGLSKNGKNAFYTGPATALRFPLSAFVDKKAPQSIDVADVFAVKPVKTPKVKLTKEQRAALPKPTLAEKIERRRAALAKLEAKAAADAQASL